MKLMKVIALVSFASIVVVGTALAAKQGIKPKESESWGISRSNRFTGLHHIGMTNTCFILRIFLSILQNR